MSAEMPQIVSVSSGVHWSLSSDLQAFLILHPTHQNIFK